MSTLNSIQQDHIQKTTEHVQNLFAGEGTGHDWWHILRVRNTALKLAQEEGADMYITELGALLHDIADHKFHDGDDQVGPKVARAWMEELGAESSAIEAVVNIVKEVTFKGAGVDTPVSSLEGQCVQDADRIDALGAVGIARTFAYGGAKSREIYNPNIKPEPHQSFEAYKNSTAPTINHFYEKLLLLQDRMNTESGKRLAAARHRYMEQYLEQFYGEWNGER